MTEVADSRPRVVRRKFATPPVKLACLSCRSSRTRCDGAHPCASCVTKGNDCVYRPSRRGGPRVRKKAALISALRTAPDIRPQEADMLPPVDLQPIAVQNFIDPGAGLGQLPDLPQNSDFIFDSLFPGTFSDGVFDGVSLPQNLLSVPQRSGPFVRTYSSDRALLQAYYCWIHPYVPIFPPPEASQPVDDPYALSQSQPGSNGDYEPSTPVALALSAVLALIPCSEDMDPNTPESIVFRRKCAQFFAQSAIESIEAESELLESATEPSKALESSPPPADRPAFHPRTPVELESIIALNLLSIYEYAQRGNIKKMRTRAGQALVDAMMTFSLHAQTDDDDFFAEAKRRVWWMTYVCATQSSIVSNTPPPLELFGADFTTKYPTLEADPEAWPLFIEAQQCILASTQFVIEQNKVFAVQGNMDPIYKKMMQLEDRIGPLVEKSESWVPTGDLAPPVDSTENCLVRSLRSMARIKLNSARIKIHRYCAFHDIPVFSGNYCDLKSASESSPASGYEALLFPSCSCSPQSFPSLPSMNSSSHHHSTSASAKTSSPESSSYVSSFGSPKTADSTPLHPGHDSGAGLNGLSSKMPMSSHHSAKLCLRSAINIATGFDTLPYPNPTGRFGQDVCFLSATSPIVAPRMLPSYVCCAMQAAYVFLSIYRKTKALQLGTASSAYLVSMLLQLQRGLTSILSALENYATAFEALRSMRDQIRLSAESLMALEA
ncbi:c6 zinc finger domain containing protein [Niveomyces insectorum RCEF 264]|uniref:C6 zinc finger domain containing protein n=1 Tax=Niveomyces insectorum RCEF 264 TaxID=1081102 RepID=A0A167Z4R1_9HYPO|nr:c6 zinc finger domain containing protein [Niveomyces insectorum RCEF 264]